MTLHVLNVDIVKIRKKAIKYQMKIVGSDNLSYTQYVTKFN
jgi:hypothetical protein